MTAHTDLLPLYARLGYRLFPVHSSRDGGCTCWKGTDCKDHAKHPVVKGWQQAATADLPTLRAYADERPWANWGIATGSGCGLLVLDIDPRHGGDASLAELVARHGPLPATPTVHTGGGGRQFYFKYPAGCGLTVGNGVRPGIDFRCEGGFVVAPPSLHKSGRRYEWAVPADIPLADPPGWLLDVLTTGKPSAPPPPRGGGGGGLVLTVRADLTGDGVAEGGRHGGLCQRVGVHLNRGDSRTSVEALAHAWGGRCDPPMDPDEVAQVVADLWAKHHGNDEGEGDSGDEPDTGTPTTLANDPPSDDWPTLHPDALYGLAGQVVRAIAPETEADPAGVLLCVLAAVGSAVGPGPHVLVGADTHRANTFVCLVGDTASGKGQAWGLVSRLMTAADPPWAATCVGYGLSSGEGLVERVRDAVVEHRPVADRDGRVAVLDPVVVDPGAADKRLLCYEAEFAKLFSVKGREGNTLGANLRAAWDGSTLEVMTRRQSALKATGHHVSIVGNVTPDELAACLGRGTDTVNGFVNRFLWPVVKRSRLLPHGGDARVLDAFVAPLAAAVAAARGRGAMGRTPAANRLWEAVYPALAEGRVGAFGKATERARPQAVRLALVYALLDGAVAVDVAHLRAALAVWAYCEASARRLFGPAVATTPAVPGGGLTAKLLTAITAQPGINRRGLYEATGNRAKREDMDAALAHLKTHGLAHPKPVGTGATAAECWSPGPDNSGGSVLSLVVAGEPASLDQPSPQPVEPTLPPSAAAPAAAEGEAVVPYKANTIITPLPMPPDGELTALTLPALFDAVRDTGARLGRQGEEVVVVPSDRATPAVTFAVAEHQEHLRLLVPAEPPVSL